MSLTNNDSYNKNSMMSVCKSFDDIKKIWDKYVGDKRYVYKVCNNGASELREWLVVMEMCDGTETNEDRKNVIKADHAKFRANKLRVVDIININSGLPTGKIVNSYWNYAPLEYKVGAIVECDKFDYDINKVCSSGIHYFKTLVTAYYYNYDYHRIHQNGYTGEWMQWYDCGQIKSVLSYDKGILNGSWIIYHDNGNICEERNYKDGKINGKYIMRNYDGRKTFEADCVNGSFDGLYTTWYLNGNKSAEGLYKNGERNGLWIDWSTSGQKLFEEIYCDGIKVKSYKI